jgi:cobalt/nickel transport system permease protein
MLTGLLPPLWAVHISDGVLQLSWQLAGFCLAGLLMLLGAWRLREEDLPSTALLAAAFFVASLIHVRVGPSSAHLLLNGLLGVLLGRRAALAIPAGLLLQALLLGHGGLMSLGVNSCVLVLPALVVHWLFLLLRRNRWTTVLILASDLLLALSLVAGIWFLVTGSGASVVVAPVVRLELHPGLLAGCLVVLLVVVIRSVIRRGIAPEAALGRFLGQLAVLLTLLLQGAVLVLGGESGSASWGKLVAVLFLVHLSIAVIEGVILGFTLEFLARVRPQLLGLSPPSTPEGSACSAAAVPCETP